MNMYEEPPFIWGRKGTAFTAAILLHAVFAFALYRELLGPIAKVIAPPLILAPVTETLKETVKPPPLAPVIDSTRIDATPPEIPPLEAGPEAPVVTRVPGPERTIQPTAAQHATRVAARMDPKHPLRLGEAYYPDASRRANEMGRCVVQATVSIDGRIIAVALQSSTGYDRLDQACLSGVKGQHMLPAIEDGKPIESTISIPISWNLSEK